MVPALRLLVYLPLFLTLLVPASTGGTKRSDLLMSALCSAMGMFEGGPTKAAPAPAKAAEPPGTLAPVTPADPGLAAPPFRAELEPLAELGCPEVSAAPFLD